MSCCEERAQGAVGQAGGQDGILGGAAFAAEERTGDASAGVHAFFVFHGEREEILPLAGFLAHGGGGEDDGVAQAHGDGAAGLSGQFAGFNNDRFAADFGGILFCFWFHYCKFPFLFPTWSGTEGCWMDHAG